MMTREERDLMLRLRGRAGRMEHFAARFAEALRPLAENGEDGFPAPRICDAVRARRVLEDWDRR